MENRAKLYLITITDAYQMAEEGERFSLEPWGEDSKYYKGYDDGGNDYILPAGYEVGNLTDGSVGIFDNNENYCKLVTKNNMPFIEVYKNGVADWIQLKAVK